MRLVPRHILWFYSYDASGNLVQTIDANDNKTTYAYDKTGRLTEVKHYKALTQLARTVTYTWDEAHNLTAWTDTDHTRPQGQQTANGAATYDNDNRKLTETISYPNPTGQAYSLSYSYQYTPGGKKKRLTWADGTPIDYTYSDHGELKTVTIPGEGILSVSQYKWTQPSEIILPGSSIQQKDYDGLLNLESLRVKNANQQPLLDVSNRYSKRLELLDRSRTDTVEGINSTIGNQYTYDDESRLTKAVTDDTGALFGTDTETFTLDGVNNRTAHNKVLGDLSYDANNRLIETGTLINKTNYAYDSVGSLTSKSKGGNSTYYRYDSQHRLTEVQDTNHNAIARYGYDPFDRRIWKEAYRNKDGAVLDKPTRSYYLYADEGLIAESRQDIAINNGQTVTASTAPAITTQYGPRPDGEFTTAVLFTKAKNSEGQDTIAYYHHDHLGTPIQATDRGGNVVWSAQVSAFGKANITTPTPADGRPIIDSALRFPGQLEDAETGLYYNWHRYYDSETGRYVTADPIGFKGGINYYSYVSANPIAYIDPSGENPLEPIIIICSRNPRLCAAVMTCVRNPKACTEAMCRAMRTGYKLLCNVSSKQLGGHNRACNGDEGCYLSTVKCGIDGGCCLMRGAYNLCKYGGKGHRKKDGSRGDDDEATENDCKGAKKCCLQAINKCKGCEGHKVNLKIY